LTISHQAFLQAIIEHPDDDAPRLVYADWLDDHGDPERAEFIRLQCQLARAFDPGLAQREKELLDAHGARFRKPFAERHRVQFHRGFISDATITATELDRRGAYFFRKAPLQTLRLGYEESDANPTLFTRLAHRPWLAQLRMLSLDGHAIGEEEGRALFASPHLAGLRALVLGEGDANAGMVEVLGGSALTGLRELYLGDFHQGELRDAGLTLLANTPLFTGLTTLDLLHNGIGPVGARALAESPYLRSLERLSLGQMVCGYSNNRIGPEGARALAGSANLAGLVDLSLALNRLGDEGVSALAGSQHLVRLRNLNLEANEISDAGLIALVESTSLTSLSWLNLSYNRVSDEGVAALVSSPKAARLELLWLLSNNVGPAGVKALVNSPHLARLERLSLSGNPIGHAGVSLLVRSKGFEHLKELNLMMTDITEADKKALVGRFGVRVKL
jgi:uncharacterized protein (TIGR02996 family)